MSILSTLSKLKKKKDGNGRNTLFSVPGKVKGRVDTGQLGQRGQT